MMKALTTAQIELLQKLPFTATKALIDKKRDAMLQKMEEKGLVESVQIDALRTRWKTTKYGRAMMP